MSICSHLLSNYSIEILKELIFTQRFCQRENKHNSVQFFLKSRDWYGERKSPGQSSHRSLKFFTSVSFLVATPLAPHASDLDLLLAVNKKINVLNVKAVTFLLQMVSLPVLLIIILASSVMGRPRAQSLDCIQYCDGQYRMCQSSCDDWDDCVSCTICNEVCITSCTKQGVVKACWDYLNEMVIEQEMEKQSSQLQQEGQD